MGDDLAPGSPALLHQILAHRDEIGERVRFLRQLAFAIPAPALLAAATHMGDGVDEAAIDEREPVGIEGGRDRNAVRAVAVEQGRARCRRAHDPCGKEARSEWSRRPPPARTAVG